ncbi:MAG: KH domain-containing protein [Anaerolineae bacterium]|jgi:uncharacterized protein|nr:KH domain-containing protein [Anaerolineae bacterium]MBT7075267.1 KH domain-containing protein [Anaerolineae bacterium]MBT7783211.1 KH domain-containing protein [Anaerolineae bacterium]
MKELIEYISRSLVDEPEDVSVEEYESGRHVEIELSVAQKDMGRVIGKRGKVANAMRALLRVAAEREGKKASLDILEP